MLTKHLFIIFAISTSIAAMEITEPEVKQGECVVTLNPLSTQITPEVFAAKACRVMQTNDKELNSIFKELFAQRLDEAKFPELARKRADIIKKITDSEE